MSMRRGIPLKLPSGGFGQLALSAVLTTLATLLASAAATVRVLLLLTGCVWAALLAAVTLVVLALVTLPLVALAGLVLLILIHGHLIGIFFGIFFRGVRPTVRSLIRSCRFHQ
jgi:hypothetical protein